MVNGYPSKGCSAVFMEKPLSACSGLAPTSAVSQPHLTEEHSARSDGIILWAVKTRLHDWLEHLVLASCNFVFDVTQMTFPQAAFPNPYLEDLKPFLVSQDSPPIFHLDSRGHTMSHNGGVGRYACRHPFPRSEAHHFSGALVTEVVPENRQPVEGASRGHGGGFAGVRSRALWQCSSPRGTYRHVKTYCSCRLASVHAYKLRRTILGYQGDSSIPRSHGFSPPTWPASCSAFGHQGISRLPCHRYRFLDGVRPAVLFALVLKCPCLIMTRCAGSTALPSCRPTYTFAIVVRMTRV